MICHTLKVPISLHRHQRETRLKLSDMFYQGTPISQGHGEQPCGLASAHKLMTHSLRHGDEPSAAPGARAEAPKSHRCNSKCHCTAPQCLGMVLPAVMYVTEILSSNVMSTAFYYSTSYLSSFVIAQFAFSLCMRFLKLNLIFIT